MKSNRRILLENRLRAFLIPIVQSIIAENIKPDYVEEFEQLSGISAKKTGNPRDPYEFVKGKTVAVANSDGKFALYTITGKKRAFLKTVNDANTAYRVLKQYGYL